MSAISSAGSSSLSLYLQQLQKQQAQNDQIGDDASSSTGGIQGSGSNAQPGSVRFLARFEAAAKSLGIDPSKLPDLEKQIQAAVQEARQNGSASGDTRSAIRDAINGVLKSNGIDPAKFDAALKAQGPQNAAFQKGAQASGPHRHHHGGHHKAAPADASQSADTTLNIFAKPVQPGQTTGTLMDASA